MRRLRTWIELVFGLGCWLAIMPIALAQQKPRLDGAWWRQLYPNEKVEFVAGYIDCYADDLGDKNNTFRESWYTYAPRITDYYEKNPTSTNRLASSVLFDVRSPHPPKPPKGGETWAEKHGFFNGEYWLEMGKGEQELFITGYLACYSEHLSARKQKFSLTSERYSQKISNWFEKNPKGLRTAIADVLYKFADP